MARDDFLTPLNDLAYLIECASLDYTGELKSGLSTLCANIQEHATGYESQVVQKALPQLQKALESYRASQKEAGAILLAGVSRKWWAERA